MRLFIYMTHMLYAVARYAAMANRLLARDVCSGLCALPLGVELSLHKKPVFGSLLSLCEARCNAMLLSDGRLSQTRSARNDERMLLMAPSLRACEQVRPAA
jgi:hypothetical protein